MPHIIQQPQKFLQYTKKIQFQNLQHQFLVSDEGFVREYKCQVIKNDSKLAYNERSYRKLYTCWSEPSSTLSIVVVIARLIPLTMEDTSISLVQMTG